MYLASVWRKKFHYQSGSSDDVDPTFLTSTHLTDFGDLNVDSSALLIGAAAKELDFMIDSDE